MGQIKNIKLHIVTDIKRHSIMVNVPTSVQVFGRKKTATAVAFCKRGNGLIKVNGRPLDLVEPVTLRMKVQEPVLIIVRNGSHPSTSVSVFEVVDKSHRSTQFDKRLRRPSLRTT